MLISLLLTLPVVHTTESAEALCNVEEQIGSVGASCETGKSANRRIETQHKLDQLEAQRDQLEEYRVQVDQFETAQPNASWTSHQSTRSDESLSDFWRTTQEALGVHFQSPSGMQIPFEFRKSPGKGIGLFITAPVTKGAAVWTSGNEVTFGSAEQWASFLLEVPPHLRCDVQKWAYSSSARSISVALDEASFFNSACDDTGVVRPTIACDPRGCYANDDLVTGQELLEDYSVAYVSRPAWVYRISDASGCKESWIAHDPCIVDPLQLLREDEAQVRAATRETIEPFVLSMGFREDLQNAWTVAGGDSLPNSRNLEVPFEIGPSVYGGLGIFAKGSVASGSLVLLRERTRRFVAQEQWAKFLSALPLKARCDVQAWSYSLKDLTVEFDFDESSLLHYSEQPNLGVHLQTDRYPGASYALRDISVGEELLRSYPFVPRPEWFFDIRLASGCEQPEE